MFFGKKKKTTDFTPVERGVGGHTLIASSVSITGDVRFSGTLRVDGKIDGKISVLEGETGTVVLSRGSVINGPIHTTNLIVDGNVNGNVNVLERVDCRSNARINGHVKYGMINISEGALIEGRCTQRAEVEQSRAREASHSSDEVLSVADFLRKE